MPGRSFGQLHTDNKAEQLAEELLKAENKANAKTAKKQRRSADKKEHVV